MKSFKQLKPTRSQFIAAAILFTSMGLSYAAVTIPNTFTAGTAAKAADVNANFTAVANQMPGVEWATISTTNINVRTAAVNVATINVSAPTSGYIVVRFDGQAYASTGDTLVLAASNVSGSWGVNDGNISFMGDGNPHPFSHTRVYAVSAAGTYTYYAVAHNYVNTLGSGLASIYGTITAQFYPNRY